MNGRELRDWLARSSLFRQALTHPTRANETGEPSNQRLEYLGDSVLGLIVTDLLYRRFPNLAEGDLSRLRIALVREEALAGRARSLGLASLLRLGTGERRMKLAGLPSTLCDTYEAMVGALYLEQGFEPAYRFVAEGLDAELRELGGELWRVDPKSALQEAIQKNGRAPSYREVKEEGPKHRPVYTVVVEDDGHEIGRGTGHSKKAAEEAAALTALRKHPHLLPSPVTEAPSTGESVPPPAPRPKRPPEGRSGDRRPPRTAGRPGRRTPATAEGSPPRPPLK